MRADNDGLLLQDVLTGLADGYSQVQVVGVELLVRGMWGLVNDCVSLFYVSKVFCCGHHGQA